MRPGRHLLAMAALLFGAMAVPAQAANGTQQVSSNIADVQRGASETGSASAQVLTAAKSLSGESDRLKREVGKFLGSVRAA